MVDWSQKSGKDTTNKPKWARKIILGFAFVISVTTLILVGVTCYFYFTSATIHDVVRTAVTRAASPEKAFPGQTAVDVLLMGRDVDRDRRGRIVHTRGRTDCMLLAHIDFENRHINILSIPRDTLTKIPGYRGRRRISYANAFGGPQLAMRAVGQLTSVSPDHYVLINFEGFEKAIDAIGGLEVTVDKQLDYDDNWGNLHIHLKPGWQLLTGEQAMGFVRYRQSNDGEAESDFARICRQQELLKAAKAKLADPRTMIMIPRVLDLIRADTETSLTAPQLLCLAAFAKSLPSSAVRMETLPALNQNTIFVRVDTDAAQKLVEEMFLDEPGMKNHAFLSEQNTNGDCQRN